MKGITAIEARRRATVVAGVLAAVAAPSSRWLQCRNARRTVGRGPCDRQASRIGAAVETLGLEQPGRRRQMLLALADPAAPGERIQQELVHALVKWRERQPFSR